MASAAATAREKATDTMVDSKIPLFNKEIYSEWQDQIYAEILMHPKAGKVVGGSKDPATKFALLYPEQYEQIDDQYKPANEQAVKEDPAGTLKVFLDGVYQVPSKRMQDRDVSDASEGSAVAEAKVPAIFDVQLKRELQRDVDNWIAGEQIIYALLTKSLVKAQHLKCGPIGAGRKQLDSLKSYWMLNTAKTTLALDDSRFAWTYRKSEGLLSYGHRYQRMLNDCRKAKPNPIVYNTEQQFNCYVRGLKRMNMFASHIAVGKGLGHVTWEALHEYLKGEEDEAGDLIRRRYDVSKAEVSNANCGKELCQHYATTGNCRFADKCKFEHPQWATDKWSKLSKKAHGRDKKNKKFKKKKKQSNKAKCYEFYYTGKCARGDECRFSHKETRKKSKKKKKKKRRKRRSDSSESSDPEVGAAYALADIEMFSAYDVEVVEESVDAAAATGSSMSAGAAAAAKVPKNKPSQVPKVVYTVGVEAYNPRWREVHDAYDSDDLDWGGDSVQIVQVDVTSSRAKSYLAEIDPYSRKCCLRDAYRWPGGKRSSKLWLQYVAKKMHDKALQAKALEKWCKVAAHAKSEEDALEASRIDVDVAKEQLQRIKANDVAEISMMNAENADKEQKSPSQDSEQEFKEARVTAMSFTENRHKDKDGRPMMDSGATHGLTNDRKKLINIKPVMFKVRGVVGVRKVTEMGTYIGCKGGHCEGVLLLESAPRDVLAVRQVREQYPGKITMDDDLKHVSRSGKRTAMGPLTSNGWYRVERLPTSNVHTLNAEASDGTDGDDEFDTDDEGYESDSRSKKKVLPPLVDVTSGEEETESDSSTDDTDSSTEDTDDTDSSTEDTDSEDSDSMSEYLVPSSDSVSDSSSEEEQLQNEASDSDSEDEPPDLKDKSDSEEEESDDDSESEETLAVRKQIEDARLQALEVSTQLKREKVMRFHQNLGHASKKKMRLTLALGSVHGLVPKDVDLFVKCDGCAMANPKRKSHKLKAQRGEKAFGTHISMDNSGPQPVRSRGGKKLLNVGVDHESNWKFVEALKSKTRSVDRLRYIVFQECDSVTKVVRTDQGGEFMNYEMGDLMEEIGAKHETSASGVSQQNGRAEKAIQDIMGKVRVGLYTLGRGLDLWAAAAKHVTHLMNRLPCFANEDAASPYFIRYGRHPDYREMQPFGQQCTAMFPKKKKKERRLSTLSIKGILIGYDEADGTRGYRVMSDRTGRVFVSPDVEFLDHLGKGNLLPDVHLLCDHGEDVEDQKQKGKQVSMEPEVPEEKVGDVHTTPTGDVLPDDDNIKMLPEPPVQTHTNRVQKPQDRVQTSSVQPEQKAVKVKSETVPRENAKMVQPARTPMKTRSQTRAKAKLPVSEPIKLPTPTRTKAKSAGKRKTPAKGSPRRSGRTKHVKGKYQFQADATKSGGEAESKDFDLSTVKTKTIIACINAVAGVTDLDKEAATIIEPDNHKEAVNDSEHGVEWIKAEKDQVRELLTNQTFKEVKLKDLPAGTRIVSSRWVYKVKPDEDGKVAVFKARIVARGNEYVHYDDTYSPVANATSIKMLLAIAVSLKLHLRQVDFKSAFLHAKRDKTMKKIYMRPPPGVDCPPGKVWLILRAIYGLPDSPLLWFKTLTEFLKTLGFKQSYADPCLLYRITKSEYTILTMVVDDILMASNKEKVLDEVVDAMKKKFRTKDLGKPEYVIGMHINYDREKQVLKLNQELYLETLAKKYGMENSRPVKTPADKGSQLKKDMGGEPTDKDYRSLVGSLLYAVNTRPDIAVIVSSLSKFNDCAQTGHWTAAIRVLKFLYHTRKICLTYRPKVKPGEETEVFGDSTWNSDEETSRSRDGFLSLFNSCAVSWRSRMQKLVTLSSCEAEYVAYGEAIKEALWLLQLAKELGFPQKHVTVKVDNQSAKRLAEHSMIRPRTKHIRMRYHWIREHVNRGEIKLEYVPTAENKADAMTKNLGREKMRQLMANVLE